MTSSGMLGSRGLAESVRPWDRQPRESSKAYQAFLEYRGQGGQRSYAKVGEKLGKSKTLIERWGRLWRWQQRIRDWELDQEKERQRENKRAIVEMNERHAMIAKLLMEKVLEKLKDEEVDPAWAAHLPRWLTTSVTVERTARGLIPGLKLSAVEQIDPTELVRPEGDEISEAIKALSPVDRELLRVISLKRLRITELQARIAARAALPEALKENTENPDG